MKLYIYMKTPDAVERAIDNNISDRYGFGGHIKESEAEQIDEDVAAFKKLCRRFFQHGEAIRLEVDTEEGTCVVVPV